MAGGEGSTPGAPEPEHSTEHPTAMAAITAAAPSLVTVGPGLPTLSKKLVEKIASGVYVDFAELPPAKGKGRASPQVAEGQIVIMQASDMVSNKKAIPDLATWLQCFGLYVAVIASRQPSRVPDLMVAYQALIAPILPLAILAGI